MLIIVFWALGNIVCVCQSNNTCVSWYSIFAGLLAIEGGRMPGAKGLDSFQFPYNYLLIVIFRLGVGVGRT